MQRRQERAKKMEEKKVYLQLYEAMEALVKIDLETNKIMDFIKFDVGNVVMVTGGRNIGRVGVIKNREKHKGSFETIHMLLGAFCYVYFSPICRTGKHRIEFKFGGRKSVETLIHIKLGLTLMQTVVF
jgi:hypothetical protein